MRKKQDPNKPFQHPKKKDDIDLLSLKISVNCSSAIGIATGGYLGYHAAEKISAFAKAGNLEAICLANEACENAISAVVNSHGMENLLYISATAAGANYMMAIAWGILGFAVMWYRKKRYGRETMPFLELSKDSNQE